MGSQNTVKQPLFFNQKNETTSDLYKYLKAHYTEKNKAPKDSYINQIKIVEKITKIEIKENNADNLLKAINETFEIKNKGLIDSINFIINKHSLDRSYIIIKHLNIILDYKMYINDLNNLNNLNNFEI